MVSRNSIQRAIIFSLALMIVILVSGCTQLNGSSDNTTITKTGQPEINNTGKVTGNNVSATPTSKQIAKNATGQATGKNISATPTSKPTAANATSQPTGKNISATPTSKPTATNATSQPTGKNISATPTSKPTATNATSQPTGKNVSATPTSKPTATNTKGQVTLKATETPTPTPTPVPTTQRVFTPSEISQHFMDVAFSPDNSAIIRWQAQGVTVAISGEYTPADVNITNEFLTTFNAYSSTTELSKDVKESSTGDIVMIFMSEEDLEGVEKGIGEQKSTKISRNFKTGKINYLIKPANFFTDKPTVEVCVNSAFAGNERTHWYLRSLLYALGFTGETGTYPQSIFYSGENNTIAQLDLIDWKVVELMYGRQISNGMAKSTVKSKIS